MSERCTAHLLIEGDVQGVGFRVWTQRRAALARLEGFVRNRRDGRVEAVLAGPAEAVREMIEACRQGPRGCRVDRIEVEEAVDAALANLIEPGRFEIRHTI
jgi:acylphosphatase